MRDVCWLLLILGLATLLAASCQPTDAPNSSRPNVLFLVWDTVRADRLSCQGYAAATTPRVCEIAQQGRRFERFGSTSNWTVPSHASFFTGLYPDEHGAVGHRGRLDGAHVTLAERLGEAGYETWFFSANPYVSERHNMTQGFEYVSYSWQPRFAEAIERSLASRVDHGEHLKRGKVPFKEAGPPLRDALFAWLDERDASRPFFAFVNLMEAHWPWYPTREERSRFLEPALVEHSYEMDHSYAARYTASFGFGGYGPDDYAATGGLYDAALSHLDRVTGEIAAGLDARGLGESTVLVIVSDHGDNLGDHGLLGHEYSVHESLLHVPLILRCPGVIEPGVDRAPAQSPDLYPTLLRLAGLGLNAGDVGGLDLLDPAAAPAREARPEVGAYLVPKPRAVNIVARSHPELDRERWLSPIRSYREGRFKLHRWDDGRVLLFDLVADPGETRDLAPEMPDEASRLSARLDAWIEAHPRRTDSGADDLAEDDEEHLERLRSLGYGGAGR